MSEEVSSVENEESQGVTEEEKETATAIATQIAEEQSEELIAQNLSMQKVAEDVVHRANSDGEVSVAEMTSIAIDEIEEESDEQSENQGNNSDSSDKDQQNNGKPGIASDVPQYHDDGIAHTAEEAVQAIRDNAELFCVESADGARRMEVWREENAALQVDYAVQTDQYLIEVDLDGDGQKETVSLMDAVAATNDSVLDLYINQAFDDVLAKMETENWDDIMSDRGIRELALKGIRIEAIDGLDTGTRAYSLSLIDVPDDVRELMQKPESELSKEEIQKIIDAVYDPDAKVLKDADGKLGSCIKTDNTTADGYVQPTESNLASILDMMGYDCLSKADFIGNEDEYWALMEQIQADINNGAYSGGQSYNSIYGRTLNNGNAGTYDGRLIGSNYGGGESGNDWFNEFMKKFGLENKEQNTQYQAYVQQLVNEQIAQYKEEYGIQPNSATIAQFTYSAEQQAEIMYS